MNLDNLTIKVNKMKKVINFATIACLLLSPTVSIAEHMVFGKIIIDRSEIVVFIEKGGNNKEIKLVAIIGNGMSYGKEFKAKCSSDKDIDTDKLSAKLAKHLNESTQTSFKMLLMAAEETVKLSCSRL